MGINFKKISVILVILFFVSICFMNFSFAENTDSSNSNDISDTNIVSNKNVNTIETANSNVKSNSVQTVTPKSRLTVIVKEAYNKTSKKLSEDGFAVKGAYVRITDLSKNLVSSGYTDQYGKVNFDLNPGTYLINISYLNSTYLSYSGTKTLSYYSDNFTHLFVPDIIFVTPYSGNKIKIDKLMNVSDRVYYLDSQASKTDLLKMQWILDYANFIYIDMYMTGSYEFSYEWFIDTPANKKGNIAYCFGDYSDVDSYGLNFIGGNVSSIENTFVGTYYQAEELPLSEVLIKNMENLFDYILFLMNESNIDPTEDTNRTPLIDSIWGIYHPNLEEQVIDFRPNPEDVANWIRTNPGFDSDGQGSLNWMVENYIEWLNTTSISDLFERFENLYNEYKKANNITESGYVIIASYGYGGSLVDALIKGYESKKRPSFNVFQRVTSPSMASILLNVSSKFNIVAVNSLYSWSMDYNNMGDGGAIDEFTKINVEILKALHDISEYSYNSQYGPQSEWTYGVTIPSMEGVYGAIAVSYVDKDGNSHVIKDGVKKLVETTLGWANLKEKDNFDKKIAVILYNYPPGKAEIGASYLDVFQSVHDLLVQLSRAGYNIGMSEEEIPNSTTLYTLLSMFGNKGSWAQGLLDSYVEGKWDKLVKDPNDLAIIESYLKYFDLNKNNQLVDLLQYIKFYKSLNKTLQDQLIKKWGSGIGNIMVYNDSYIVIPGMMCGNIFITFQPSRGWEEVENYHDLTLPPHQQYITFYCWLKEVFKADAMIHMGTHGTLEFLPGRSIGLQGDDWTFELSGIPNIYPYIVSNPGEALVAKERSMALVISHMTPAMVVSELYDDLVKLNSYMALYNEHMNKGEISLAESYKNLILNLSKELYFDGPTKNQSFDKWLDELHHYLEDLDNDIITFGLHSLGYVLTGDEMVQEVITIVSSKTHIYNYIKNMLYPEYKDIDYNDMKYDQKYHNVTNKTQEWLINFIEQLLMGNITNMTKFFNESGIIDETFMSNLDYCNQTIRNIQDNMEWESILKALSGEYVLPGLAVDPAYGESLPTGRNIYTTDTTKMPSQAAWGAGKKIVDQLLVQYYEKNGKFPELVGLVMWGTEILRTEGIGIAEFLYFLGVSPEWDKTGKVTGVSLIPLEDLKIKLSNGKVINRPRIDVYASAVTSNVYWISLMVNAVKLVNDTEESFKWNYVKKHYNETPSLDRIFGLPGAVLEGTGMSDYIPNTDKWWNSTNLTKDLAEIYLSRVSNSWTVDENGRLVVSEKRGTYEYLLGKTDLITQNIDSTWRFLDSDDYYDWFGGLLGASQYLGANPDTGIVDIRNSNNYVSRTLEEEIEFEIRSMILNPKYRDELLKSASGWLSYSEKYEYIFGFVSTATGKGGKSLISDSVWNGLAKNLLDSSFNVNSDYKSASFQSMAGWILVAAQKGMFKADPKVLQEIIDKYINATRNYGVACCHHTCANLEFNKWVVQASSLSYNEKKEFLEELQSSTKVKYDVSAILGTERYEGQLQEWGSQDLSGYQGKSQYSPNTQGAMNPDGGSGDSSSAGESGANGPNGEAGTSGDSSSQGDQSSSAAGQGDSKSYEVDKNQQNTSGEESGVSAAFIVAVLALIGLFVVGYVRNKSEE